MLSKSRWTNICTHAHIAAPMPNHPLRLALLSLLAATAAYATPTGLNNIPTADTPPMGTFVLQTYSTLGGFADGDFSLGFKTGIDFNFVKFEVGADSRVYWPNQGGPVAVQGKVAVPLGEHLPTIAVGAANVAFSEHQRERAGDVFGYVVATEDLGWFRVHGGCAWVDTEALPFAGIDKTFRYTKQVPASDGKAVADGKSCCKASLETKTVDLFMIKADVIAQRDSSWLYAVGAEVPICKFFLLETWANLPDNGDSPSWTVKGNFIFRF